MDTKKDWGLRRRNQHVVPGISREKLDEEIKKFQKKGGTITKLNPLNIEEERAIRKVLNVSTQIH